MPPLFHSIAIYEFVLITMTGHAIYLPPFIITSQRLEYHIEMNLFELAVDLTEGNVPGT